MSQPLVLPEVVASMLAKFAPVFTKPSFETFSHYVGALMLGEGRRTGAAIARSCAQAKSQGIYARLCSRARWSADMLLDQLWDNSGGQFRGHHTKLPGSALSLPPIGT